MSMKGEKKVIYVLNMKCFISFLPSDAVDSPVAAAAFGQTKEIEHAVMIAGRACVCMGFLGFARGCINFIFYFPFLRLYSPCPPLFVSSLLSLLECT